MAETNVLPTIVEETNISTVNVDQALEEWNAYQEITEKMLDESDYQPIKGKMYKKKSAWRKYARAFNINTEIMEKEIIKSEKTGAVKEASFVVRASLPTGRYADGWGNCSRGERGFSHPNHDIPSTAMTRATNRAIADLIGAGEVTADEIQAEMTFQAKQNAKKKLSKKSADKKAEENEVIGAEVVEAEIVAEVSKKMKEANEAKVDNETVETIDGTIEIEADEPVPRNEFTTADKAEPLAVNPVIITYAKNVAQEVVSKGRKLTQRTMILKARGMVKRGEIPEEYCEELVEFIKINCPGDAK